MLFTSNVYRRDGEHQIPQWARGDCREQPRTPPCWHSHTQPSGWTDGQMDPAALQPGSAGTIANVAHHHLTWGDIPSPAEGQGPAPSPFPSSLSHRTRLFDLAQEPLAICCGGQGDALHPGQLLHPLLSSQLQGMFLHPSPPPPARQGASGGSGSALPPSPRQSGGSSTG